MRALWSDRQNCSHHVSQKVKRIRCFSEIAEIVRVATPAEPPCEQTTFLVVQIMGGEKLLEKCR